MSWWSHLIDRDLLTLHPTLNTKTVNINNIEQVLVGIYLILYTSRKIPYEEAVCNENCEATMKTKALRPFGLFRGSALCSSTQKDVMKRQPVADAL
ncbi:hypothetical protein TNCV_3897841 [Trichonephila clavipes]|nr:hypothetical protein TNCV_3897841 [Trichonephila clavipes]